MEEIRERVIKVVSEITNMNSDKIRNSGKFSELENWDSLMHLNVVLGLEREFGIHFDIQEVMLVNSMQQAAELIAQKQN